jgi:hypothetical protein
MSTLQYKGFTIIPRTYEIRGSGRWTHDLLIGRREALRAFTRPETYSTEAAAILGCVAFARRLIDQRGSVDSLAELEDA